MKKVLIVSHFVTSVSFGNWKTTVINTCLGMCGIESVFQIFATVSCYKNKTVISSSESKILCLFITFISASAIFFCYLFPISASFCPFLCFSSMRSPMLFSLSGVLFVPFFVSYFYFSCPGAFH